MYTRVIKSTKELDYFNWIKENNFSLISPRHRGIYAEMVFKKFCQKNKIIAIKTNSYLEVLDQIPANFLKKTQQKELKKLGKICADFFCFEKKSGFFVVLKMGTSPVSKAERQLVSQLHKNNLFLIRVFEDGEILIKKLKNYL